MNSNLDLTVRRIDGRFRVVASDSKWLETADGCFERNPDPITEHTHERGFTDRDEAWRFLRQIRRGLEQGRDLNLEHWE